MLDYEFACIIIIRVIILIIIIIIIIIIISATSVRRIKITNSTVTSVLFSV